MSSPAAVAAPAAYAQTEPSELGGDLYPPSGYPTDTSSGIVPIGNYDIGCANHGFLGDVTCMTVGAATNLIFSLGKLLVGVSVWLLEAAIGFTLETALTDASTSLANLLDTRVLGPMRLSHLGLVVSANGLQFHEPVKGHVFISRHDSPARPVGCAGVDPRQRRGFGLLGTRATARRALVNGFECRRHRGNRRRDGR